MAILAVFDKFKIPTASKSRALLAAKVLRPFSCALTLFLRTAFLVRLACVVCLDAATPTFDLTEAFFFAAASKEALGA